MRAVQSPSLLVGCQTPTAEGYTNFGTPTDITNQQLISQELSLYGTHEARIVCMPPQLRVDGRGLGTPRLRQWHSG